MDMMANLLVPFNQSSNFAQSVPNVCGICSSSHYTGLCTALSDKIIPDKPHTDNLSRYSVPDGLLIIDCGEEMNNTMVITAQKFAKGTRFGPVLAPKSYVPPIRPNKFPLIIFNEIWNGDPFIDDLSDDIKELFNVRNYYLDTSDENKCNWMIHVDLAKYSNEQNLMAYQENDQIYYTSTRDIELGDILKVWYSPSYASRMGVSLLESSNNPNLCTNVRQVSFDCGAIKLHDDKTTDITNNNYLSIAPTTSSPSSEISLPPVNSLMKHQNLPSPNYNIDFDNLILMAKNEQQLTNINYQMDYIDGFQLSSVSSDADKMSQTSSSSTTTSKPIKFTEMHEAETQKYACELCARKYITKSNLEKHMRSHDLFMCVVCMKMFPNPEELKEHDCFKQKSATNKKSLFHCGICWKVLSNSWSLNRHMKIHRNVTMTPDTNLQEKSDEVSDELLSAVTSQNLLIQEPDLYTIEPNSDISNDIEKQLDNMTDDADVIGSFLNDPLDVQAWVQPIDDYNNDFPTSYPFDDLNTDNISQQLNQNEEIQLSPQQNHQPQPVQTQQADEPITATPVPPQKSQNYDKCIVCARVFKNPNSLEKHLRNVHTAHIIRPELTTSIKKSSEYRRIVLNKKPIKENVAKALVSKLSKKQQQQQQQSAEPQQIEQPVNYTQNVQAIVSEASWTTDKSQHQHQIENGNTIIIISNVELNPATSNGYTFTTNYQASTVALPKLVPISGLTKATSEVNSEQQEKFSINSSPKVFIIDKGSDKINQQIMKVPLKAASPSVDEHHQCPECEKVFQKKYQLKRHQEIHENLFYFCPFCKRAPVKARSSLRKHFIKDHPEQQDIWQASNFMSTLLKKYEKINKKSSQESQSYDSSSCSSTKKVKKGKKKGKEQFVVEATMTTTTGLISADNNNHNIINDQPLPQINIDGDDTSSHQQQQIILSNLFLDPITLDDDNNLIKYTLAGEDEWNMNGHNGESSVVNISHTGSIESYEMSEFSNFKSSFDEIQEKLDADLEFNNDQMIKWSDELDDSSSIISSQSASNLSASDIGKSLGKQKNGFMLT